MVRRTTRRGRSGASAGSSGWRAPLAPVRTRSRRSSGRSTRAQALVVSTARTEYWFEYRPAHGVLVYSGRNVLRGRVRGTFRVRGVFQAKIVSRNEAAGNRGDPPVRPEAGDRRRLARCMTIRWWAGRRRPTPSCAPSAATQMPTRRSFACTSTSPFAPPTRSSAPPPTPRRSRRRPSSRRTTPCRASARARPSVRGCSGSWRTRPETAAERSADARTSSTALRTRLPRAIRPGRPRRSSSTPSAATSFSPRWRRLKEEERTAIVARYFIGLTDEETAAALGVRRGAVKMRVFRALEHLREELGVTVDA